MLLVMTLVGKDVDWLSIVIWSMFISRYFSRFFLKLGRGDWGRVIECVVYSVLLLISIVFLVVTGLVVIVYCY